LAQRLDELSSLLLLEDSEPNVAKGVTAGLPGYINDDEGLTSIRRLRMLVGSWVYIETFLLPKIPKDHPFMEAQECKMKKAKDTLLIDLASALKEVRRNGDTDACLEIMGFFADMDSENEAVKTLKELKR
jgi:hypothetical protein